MLTHSLIPDATVLAILLAARCKTPRNCASSSPRHPISHDFIPGVGFSIPF